jgi:DNA polymerase III subunit epsilon
MSVQPPVAPRPAAQPPGDPPLARPLFHYHGPSGTEVLTDRSLAVVDLETTGFAPGGDRGDRIIEVAVVRMTPDGHIEDEWVTLLNPGRDVGPTWVHKVSQDMVVDAPDFAAVAGDLLDRLSGAVVVAHNASFEDSFLGWEFAHADLSMPPLPALCTMRLARKVMTAPNYKLATCCEAFGLVNDGAHSALGDARVTAGLVRQLLARAPELRWSAGPPSLPAGRHGLPHVRP